MHGWLHGKLYYRKDSKDRKGNVLSRWICSGKINNGTDSCPSFTIYEEEIKEGDYIAITNGEINVVADDIRSAVLGVFENVDMDDYEIITLFVGKNVSEDDRAELTEEIEELYPFCEVIVYEGGQDVYDYLIAIE